MKLNLKNKLLLLGFLIALYICYSFAISNTITYYKEFKTKEEQIAIDRNLPNIVAKLTQKDRGLDQILAQYDTTVSESFQNDLLKQLSGFSSHYQLKITDFQEPHTFTQKGLNVTSYVFSLEGSFNGTLALINKIENNPSLGAIKHLSFEKKKNYKTNTDQLFVQVIMQKTKGI